MEPNKNKSKRTKRKADEAKNLKNRTVHNLCTQSPWYEQSVVSNICEKDTFEASWNEKVKWLMKRMSVENVHLTICCTTFCNCCFFTAISPPNSRVFWVRGCCSGECARRMQLFINSRKHFCSSQTVDDGHLGAIVLHWWQFRLQDNLGYSQRSFGTLSLAV